jgi:stage III sporulation protein AD
MEILNIVGIALVVTVFAVLLREVRPEMALLLALGFGVLIFILVLSKMGAIINLFRDLTHKAQVDELYLLTLLKIGRASKRINIFPASSILLAIVPSPASRQI